MQPQRHREGKEKPQITQMSTDKKKKKEEKQED
jgi:hypothetical protein